jgi:hypothetical protein
MFCRRCGQENDANAFRCVRCGEVVQDLASAQAGPGPQPGIDVPNQMVLAILSTLLCCLPFGIVSIVYAAQVNAKLNAGDVDGAQEASRQAGMWGWISVGLGVAVWVGYALLIAAGALAKR